ncbi:MAG: hypothetical protein OHK93_001262 [Ramalina farinacea]|uniref:Uncharacterized protein n=1 Tax=Ramalina farinacea TaxID=258253 RepID=A0AA43QP71_9LECA|nr:hypothetical protein [Ramalina farinacea]
MRDNDGMTATFSRESFNPNDAFQAACAQNDVMAFMEKVRRRELAAEGARALVDEFCQFLNEERTWHLMEVVVPELRSPEIHICHDVEPEVTDNDWVPYIRYRLRHFAPPLQNHQSRDTKSREKQLMMHRWKLYTEYLLSYGEGKDALTAEQAEIVAEIIQRVSHMIPKDAITKRSSTHASSEPVDSGHEVPEDLESSDQPSESDDRARR